MIRSIFLLSLLLCCVSVESAIGQTKISGYVSLLETGDPISKVIIKLKNRQGFEITSIAPVSTDSSGYFEFFAVPESMYMIEASTVFKIEGQRVLCTNTISRFDHGEQVTTIDLRASIYYCYWIASMQPWFDGLRLSSDTEVERPYVQVSGKRISIMASGAHLATN